MNNFAEDELISMLRDGFDLRPPIRLQSLADGTNNQSFRVCSGTGEFVLKWQQNAHGVEHINFQSELLTALERSSLPFAVPSPILTSQGELAHTVRHDGRLITLILTRLIHGTHPVVGEVAIANTCGRALGTLDKALAEITPTLSGTIPDAIPSIDQELQSGLDPIRAIRSQRHRSDVPDLLESIESAWRERTHEWKQQVIHGDFFSPNILVCGEQVTGVLDFEFAGLSHRAMDLAVGLKAFCLRPVPTTASWGLIKSFAGGYLVVAPLSSDELRAIPTLLLKRESSSFIHWFGRAMEGLPDHMSIHDRADQLIELHRWLEANGRRLTDLLCETA